MDGHFWVSFIPTPFALHLQEMVGLPTDRPHPSLALHLHEIVGQAPKRCNACEGTVQTYEKYFNLSGCIILHLKVRRGVKSQQLGFMCGYTVYRHKANFRLFCFDFVLFHSGQPLSSPFPPCGSTNSVFRGPFVILYVIVRHKNSDFWCTKTATSYVFLLNP